MHNTPDPISCIFGPGKYNRKYLLHPQEKSKTDRHSHPVGYFPKLITWATRSSIFHGDNKFSNRNAHISAACIPGHLNRWEKGRADCYRYTAHAFSIVFPSCVM
eukprot:g34136.t1